MNGLTTEAGSLTSVAACAAWPGAASIAPTTAAQAAAIDSDRNPDLPDGIMKRRPSRPVPDGLHVREHPRENSGQVSCVKVNRDYWPQSERKVCGIRAQRRNERTALVRRSRMA
ncbi:hypothetical protein GCM10009765_63430 [Fodinicola feengrottensis]|uniref:Uncharacterized protein n=1 Tax=Fodinicola feengrottensis TaxID=435914 RepID=A0ABN2II65_9ACTN